MAHATQYDGDLLGALLLGWAIALDLHHLPAPSPHAENVLGAVRDVAEGRVTYADSPADIATALRSHPDIVASLNDSMPNRVASERAIARRIVSALEELGL